MNTPTAFYNGYDSFNTEDYSAEPVHVCERNGENYLGAQLSTFYFIMFLLSLIGNSLVLVIIYRFESLTTVTNIFLLNLVVSDLIFMCSLPFWGIYQQQSTWVFSTSMCKFVGSAYFLGFYSSILFLTLLTFDRHLTVVYSLIAPRLRRQSYAIACCVGVWLLSGLACVKPIILYNVFTVFNDQQFCEEHPSSVVNNTLINVSLLKSVWMYLQLFPFFLFPLAVITYCYIRITITVASSRMVSKFKTVRLIFVIVLLFFVCWTPYNVVLLKHNLLNRASTCEEMRRLGCALQVTRNIAHLYFCISPILYTFVGKKFQAHFRKLVFKIFPCFKDYATVSQTIRTNLSTRNATTQM